MSWLGQRLEWFSLKTLSQQENAMPQSMRYAGFGPYFNGIDRACWSAEKRFWQVQR
jgi:hypothetical protein